MSELVSVFTLPPPLLVWGVFTRLIGLLFLISFASLASQVVAIAGEHGAMPVRRVLAKYTEDFPGWRRFVYLPTLLWLSPSDRMLRALVVCGLAGACMTIYGGPLSPYGIALCYVAYVSLDRSIGFVFPWDCLLFEIGFFGMFLPQTQALPNVTAAALPAPLLAFAFRLLAARVLLGFGKLKFVGATKEDRGYLTGFLINQPLASPLGYLLHKAPVVLLKGAMFVMFVQEIIMPPILLVPGTPGIVAGLSIIGLMFGIWACGNFGYFNLAIICLCVTVFDSTALRAFSSGPTRSRGMVRGSSAASSRSTPSGRSGSSRTTASARRAGCTGRSSCVHGQAFCRGRRRSFASCIRCVGCIRTACFRRKTLYRACAASR